MEREFTLNSLKQKLENEREKVEKLEEKSYLLEKENLDLKYVKENFDNKVNKLNRKIRELEDNYVNKYDDGY